MRKASGAVPIILLTVTLLLLSTNPNSSAQTNPIQSIIFIQPSSISIIPVENVIIPATNYSRLYVGLAVTLKIPAGLIVKNDGFSSSNRDYIGSSYVETINQPDGTTIRRFILTLEVNPSDSYPMTADWTYFCNLATDLRSNLFDHYESTTYLTVLSPGSTPPPTESPITPSPTEYIITPPPTESPITVGGIKEFNNGGVFIFAYKRDAQSIKMKNRF